MRAPRSWGWILFWIFFTPVLLGALTLLGVRFSNRATLKRQLEEIERRGEPVELPKGEPTRDGEATLAWVKQFQDCTGENEEWTLARREQLEALLALPEAIVVSGEERLRVQRLC